MFLTSKHDDFVTDLIERISFKYDYLETHYPFKISKKSKGEIDVYATRGNEVDLYEVKCSNRITKAKKQLKRARKCLGKKGNSYFYCGSSGIIHIL